MIEDLLHENVVLSEDQASFLKKEGVTVPEDRKIGIITYLGQDHLHLETVKFLVRFNDIGQQITPEAIQDVLGIHATILLGNSAFMPKYRAIGSIELEKEVKRPSGVLRMTAKQLAEAFVTRYIAQAL